MKTIPLGRGIATLVDDLDYEYLTRWKWCSHHKLYAKRATEIGGVHKTIFMHREILKPRDGFTVDHIDGNGLNNQRCNLREATYRQNVMNQRLSNANSSGFKGVIWDKSRSLWMAYIKVHRRFVNLGRFSNAALAAQAYDSAAVKYFGEFAKTNKQLSLL